MKSVSTVWAGVLILLTAAAVAVAFRRSREDVETLLEFNGAMRVAGRWISADDEAGARRLFERRRRQGLLIDPLRIRVDPAAEAGRLVKLLRAAFQGAGVQRVLVTCGEVEETLDLFPERPFRPIHLPEAQEVFLDLCGRGRLAGHRGDGGYHVSAGEPSEVVAAKLLQWEVEPLGRPGKESPESVRARFRFMEGKARDVMALYVKFPRSREPGFTSVEACPGVPAEYVLRGVGALRAAGGVSPGVTVYGTGAHHYVWGR